MADRTRVGRAGSLLALLLALPSSSAWAQEQTYTILDPAGSYRTELVTDPQADKVVWIDQGSGQPVFEWTFGRFWQILGYSLDRGGSLWAVCYNHDMDKPADAGRFVLCRVPSPTAPRPVVVPEDYWPGVDGANGLRYDLRHLSYFRTPDDLHVLDKEALKALEAPDFDTSPGPINFPRPPEAIAAAANRLRTAGVTMLNRALESFAEKACLYETRGMRYEEPYEGMSYYRHDDSYGVASVLLSAADRARLAPLAPFPEQNDEAAMREGWRASVWRRLPLPDRLEINRRLLAYMLPPTSGLIHQLFGPPIISYTQEERGAWFLCPVITETGEQRIVVRDRRACYLIVDGQGTRLWSSRDGKPMPAIGDTTPKQAPPILTYPVEAR